MIKKQVVFMCEYGDIDRLVNENYDLPTPFEMIPDEECNNYSSKEFNVDGKPLINEWDIKDLEEFKKGKYGFKTYLILEDLCRRGIIEPGTYIVDCSW